MYVPYQYHDAVGDLGMTERLTSFGSPPLENLSIKDNRLTILRQNIILFFTNLFKYLTQ